MKKLLLIVTAVSALMASNVNWEKDLSAMAAKAQKENKKVMILMSSQSCRYCKQMHKEVFSDPVVSEYINKNFVAVELDVEHDTYPEALQVRGVPTTFFLSSDLKTGYQKVVGPRHPMNFLTILRHVQEQ